MLKKIIAMFMICAMLVPLSPVVAADETTVMPTIEEILNSYHKKAFEAQVAEENGDTSTYARGGSSSFKTLEQETVDQLTEAGYEAYNVTADNYDTVAETLNTDLAELGLNPDSSYVLVVSGEDPQTQGNSNARVASPPTQEDFGDTGSGKPYFEYIYKDKTYRLRYVSVTSTGNDTRAVESYHAPTDPAILNYIHGNLFSSIIIATADGLYEGIASGSLASFLLNLPDDQTFMEITPGSFAIHATTYWTSIFIQVWDEQNQFWDTSQSSEFTTSMVRCIGSQPGSNPSVPVPVESEPKYIKNYSSLYFNEAQRKQNAMKGYDRYTIYSDTVDRVEFYVCVKEGEIQFVNDGDSLFTHTRKLIPHLPDSYED